MDTSKHPDTIRTFIATPISENLIHFLENIQGKIRASGLKAAWAKGSSMHLTLRFFGDTHRKETTQIIQAMQQTADGIAPFSISACGTGAFPGIKNARVIWAGISGQTGQLQKIKRDLEHNLSRAGYKPDNRRFSPHFTLGRFKQRPGINKLKTVLQDFEADASAPCLIKSMVLFKSDLRPSGAVHTPLFTSYFSG